MMLAAELALAKVDVAVVEAGMGGAWDATNVADGVVSVITPIGLDHTRYLGDALEEIAAEKAGIIKPQSVAVLAQQQVEAAQVLADDLGQPVVGDRLAAPRPRALHQEDLGVLRRGAGDGFVVLDAGVGAPEVSEVRHGEQCDRRVSTTGHQVYSRQRAARRAPATPVR